MSEDKCTHQSEVKNLAYEAYGIMRVMYGEPRDQTTLDACESDLVEAWHGVAQHIMKRVRNWDNAPDLAAQLAAKDAEIERLEREVSTGLDTRRAAAQILIGRIGATVPETVIDTAVRAADRIAALEHEAQRISWAAGSISHDTDPATLRQALASSVAKVAELEGVVHAARTELMLSEDYQLLVTQGLQREQSLTRRLNALRELHGEVTKADDVTHQGRAEMTDPRHEEHVACLEQEVAPRFPGSLEGTFEINTMRRRQAVDYAVKQLRELPLMAARLRKHDARLALNFGAPSFCPTREQWQELNEATEELRLLEGAK